MSTHPVGDYVFCRIERGESKIALPDSAGPRQDDHFRVVAVGPGPWFPANEPQPMPVKVGQRVIVHVVYGEGVRTLIDGKDTYVFRARDMMAVVDD
jgi:co-chaperonin GroES (HSP10)